MPLMSPASRSVRFIMTDDAISFHCGDCHRPLLPGTTSELVSRGWRLVRLHDGLGNAVLWWRCARCVAGGVHAFGEARVDFAVPYSTSTGASTQQ
jgi:hypothetical protein